MIGVDLDSQHHACRPDAFLGIQFLRRIWVTLGGTKRRKHLALSVFGGENFFNLLFFTCSGFRTVWGVVGYVQSKGRAVRGGRHGHEALSGVP